MSSTADSQRNGDLRAAGRKIDGAGADLLRIALPPGTPDEACTAVQRLIELTSILARRSAQLQEALDSRVVIEQAKGIISERYNVGLDEAFKLLRRSARSNRMRLHDLAQRVVSSPQTPPELAVVGLPGLIRH